MTSYLYLATVRVYILQSQSLGTAVMVVECESLKLFVSQFLGLVSYGSKTARFTCGIEEREGEEE